MKYQYIQLVAYQTPTLDLTDPLPASSKPTLPAVVSLTADAPDPSLAADAQSRVQRMLDVLHWSVETIPHNLIGYRKEPDPLSPNQTNTLKVFIAPEFYFRPTPDGYSWNTMLNILECLKRSFADWRFDDWLIAPGTICSHQDPHPDPEDGKKYDSVFFNTASVIKGGINSAITFVHKKRQSTLDAAPIGDGTMDPRFQPTLGSWKEQKERLFEFEGITFGLDVCLDHLSKALKRTVIDWPANEKGVSAPDIDVHLVTSCGMQVHHESVAARTGGCVLLCDGAPNNSPWKRSAVFKVERQETTDLNKNATLTGIPEIWRQAVPNSCVIRQPASAPQWFDEEVVVYQPVKLF